MVRVLHSHPEHLRLRRCGQWCARSCAARCRASLPAARAPPLRRRGCRRACARARCHMHVCVYRRSECISWLRLQAEQLGLRHRRRQRATASCRAASAVTPQAARCRTQLAVPHLLRAEGSLRCRPVARAVVRAVVMHELRSLPALLTALISLQLSDRVRAALLPVQCVPVVLAPGPCMCCFSTLSDPAWLSMSPAHQSLCAHPASPSVPVHVSVL